MASLLGAHNSGDDTESFISATPSWTGNQAGGRITISTAGTVTQVKMKLSQNSAVQSGTMTVEVQNSGLVTVASGTLDLTTITKGDPAAWFTITVTGSPAVSVGNLLNIRAQRDQSGGIVPAWRKHDIDAFIWEVWGDEISLPSKPINPTPENAASDVTLDQETIIWEDGGGATSYDVHYGDTSGSLTLASEGQAGLSFTVDGITLGSPFDYLITRYWRIDAVNAAGTTTGDEWSFVAIAFDPPLPTGVTLDGDGNPTGTPTGESGMLTIRKLVVAANSKIWYEDI